MPSRGSGGLTGHVLWNICSQPAVSSGDGRCCGESIGKEQLVCKKREPRDEGLRVEANRSRLKPAVTPVFGVPIDVGRLDFPSQIVDEPGEEIDVLRLATERMQ